MAEKHVMYSELLRLCIQNVKQMTENKQSNTKCPGVIPAQELFRELNKHCKPNTPIVMRRDHNLNWIIQNTFNKQFT